MNYVWEITDAPSKDGLIISASYFVTLSDEEFSISSEGNWIFDSPKAITPYDKVTKEMIVQWIENASIVDGVSSIKSNLEKQMNALKTPTMAGLPWKPQTFRLS
jgi:hypothetical protein